MLRNCILMVALFICGNLFAQDQKELGQLMRERDEYYFTLNVQQASEIQTINSICSVDGTDGKNVVCYANQEQYDKLLKDGYKPTLQTPPSMREEAKMWNGNRATYEWNSYLTYEQFESMMEGFPTEAVSGRTCTLLDLGTLSTTNHRRILGVRINNGQPDGKPKFLYTSTMHGDEVTGMILMLRLIDEFCTSNDSRITNILNNVDLFIFPCTNPDGTYYGGNSTVTGARRYNGNSIDLNRHFPDFDDGAHPDGASYYQDEAQWMMDLAQEYLFTMGANYHGGAEVMNYPWDTYQPLHTDDAWWQYISLEYVSLARQVSSSYMTDTESNGITNGYAWYTITGSRQDYMNYYGQCREITIECSTTKTPSASQLPNFWNYNHNSMLTLIEECLNGIHGVVKDANTNEPIVGATITVQNHDALGSSVTSHAAGDFHRPIKGGTWTIEIAQTGYHTETVEVTVADGDREDLEVYLRPITPGEMTCYDEVLPSAAGSYVMGYFNGTTLVAPTNNNSATVTTTSVDATATDNGISVETETTLPTFTLTVSGSQYYIIYNNRYLAKSSSGSSLTWATSANTNSSWTIASNGMYITRNTTKYYLYFDTNSNSFKLSTSAQNNVKFYTEGECADPNVVEESFELTSEWNWWAPNVDIDLEAFEAALGTNGTDITNQEGDLDTNEGSGWGGSLAIIAVGNMYKVRTNQACVVTVEGTIVDPSEYPITLYPGINWMGFIGTDEMSLDAAFSNLTPTNMDYIQTKEGGATYYQGYGWRGSAKVLHPGEGFIYKSKATESKTFTYPSSK